MKIAWAHVEPGMAADKHDWAIYQIAPAGDGRNMRVFWKHQSTGQMNPRNPYYYQADSFWPYVSYFNGRRLIS